jgi:hypothetical protein
MYFQFEDKFYEMLTLSRCVIFLEHLKTWHWIQQIKNQLGCLCLIYVDDVFVVWPYGPETLQEFPHHIICIKCTIQLTKYFLFLDVVVTKRGSALVSKVCRKSTHIGFFYILNLVILHKDRSCSLLGQPVQGYVLRTL